MFGWSKSRGCERLGDSLWQWRKCKRTLSKLRSEKRRCLDLTEANITFCQLNNRFPNAYFCIGDAEKLPIGSSCCDIVLNMEASDLYPSIKSFYHEVFRVLKPGGIFVYADDLPTWKFDEGERYWHELGFALLMSRDITGEVLLSSGSKESHSRFWI
ncbi:class I SAM-dependent methyltransferase [Paenibacillus pabuli]|uniref:class I SAM-dependent methyltransferase n=1 Tax=Paenibacillus pabuli TaxID=1472 RepID=UPI00247FF49F|nr:class I SAM-dependent methyltransferase [Paenibacillus pabuli]MEC0128444.1 class I SAM-dependent methyltransferase [Paenibacillus pabuli]